MSDDLFHILSEAAWRDAQAAGIYAPASLADEGFIHLSLAGQLLRSANSYFSGQGDLLVLRIDGDALTAELRFDEVANRGIYPHLYGPLNLNAVRQVVPLPTNQHGQFDVPALWQGRAAEFRSPAMGHESQPHSLTPPQQLALELAASTAGLWSHPTGAGFYVPGAGTVPVTRNTINALVRRGLLAAEDAAMDHEVVFANTFVAEGSTGERWRPTRD